MANASRLRATLTGVWWKAQLGLIRHCHRCGGPLGRRYVSAERKRRHVCSDCGHITYLNPKVVAGLIPLMADGRIALLRREIEPARGKWQFPGGYQELGESVEEAAVRETWEEIRTRATVTRAVGIYSYADAGVVTIVYEGRVARGQKPAAGAESLEVKLVRPEEIPWKELAFRSTVAALKDWMSGLTLKSRA